MKPYIVTVKAYGLVLAKDIADAVVVGERYAGEIMDGDLNPIVAVRHEVINVESLQWGFDGDCVPLGGDGVTTIAELMQKAEGAK